MLALVIAFAIALCVEIPGLLKQGDRKQLAVYVALMAAAFGLCALIALQVIRPGFSNWVTRIGEAVFKALGLLPLLKSD